MRNALFAAAAVGVLAVAHTAAAQGIALYGDARLGLGYNIDNDGGVVTETDDAGNAVFPDDVRAISRVRFGVNMTGETDSGITFGADIRADNSQGGEGGAEGQTEGSVFVSGGWGTLSYGDTNAADEQWVGDVPGDFSVTGLTDIDETFFISNGGSFGEDAGVDFLPNPDARPTVRYDFDVGGFGFSASTNRDLNDIGVGAGYAADLAGGSWSVGVGYYDYQGFATTLADVPVVVSDGHQWSGGLQATYGNWSAGATYTNADSDGPGGFSNLILGASVGLGAWSFGAVYGNFLSADGDVEEFDGDQAYGVYGQYDLGGGASVNGGVVRAYKKALEQADDTVDFENPTIADFGIVMNF